MTINVTPDDLKRENAIPGKTRGSHCVLVKDVVPYERYGRDNLCLKVYPDGRALHEMTVIQNLAAREGWAPRVFDIIDVLGQRAQVVEYLEGHPEPWPQVVREFVRHYDLMPAHKNFDLGPINWRGEKLVDFSGFRFRDYDTYVDSLRTRVRTRRGELMAKPYQPCLGLEGRREIEYRAANMGLDIFDFAGLDVLDLGCNMGAFSRYALKRGARRVVGVDLKADLAFEINNVEGGWNIDIVKARMPKEVDLIAKQTGLETFDVVFAFAFTGHVGGYAQWIADLTHDWLFVESRGGETRADFEPALGYDFSMIQYCGQVHDNYHRHQWRCRK